MADLIFLLDTDVLSYAGLKRPPAGLRPWLRAVGAASLALCFPVITELQRGAHLAAKVDPEKGQRITTWINSLVKADFHHASLTLEVAELYARMTTLNELKHLRVNNPSQKKDKMGHDLMIASVAIVHGMPIASCNTRDFLLINGHFPLPGLYNPIEAQWYVTPASPAPQPDIAQQETETDVLIPTLNL